MKKILLSVGCVLLLILTCGCTPTLEELPLPQEYTEDTYTSDESKSTPYTMLNYSGIDTNPQHVPNSYCVNNDSDFVADIWNALNCNDWTEQEEGHTAMVTIELAFSGANSFLTVEIDPNDTGWRKGSDDHSYEASEYYSLPAGTYNRVKSLLTAYTSTHFMPDISPKLLEIDINSVVPIAFSCGEIYFQLSPQLAGEFTEIWNTDDWEELPTDYYLSSDGTIDIHGIYCKDGRGPVEITVDKEQKTVLITYDVMSKLYSVPEETIQTIYSQFNDFHLLS